MSYTPYELVHTPGETARSRLFVPLLGGYDEADASFFFERSWYPACELLLIEKGRGAFRQGGDWLPLVQGDCLLHDMRLPHAYRADADDPFAMHFLVMDGPDLETLWSRFSPAGHIRFAAGSNGPGSVRDTLLQALALMKQGAADPEQDILLSSLLYKLLITALSRAGGLAPGPPRAPEALEEARAFLDNGYLTVRQMREAAACAKMSLYHFIRQFRQHYGMTPKEYVLHKRIHHAKRLLLGTDEAIGAIAEASGFPSYNAFLHTFLRMEKQSPGEYRKQMQRRSHP